jgi:multiple sugar transport system substrate-binding protein
MKISGLRLAVISTVVVLLAGCGGTTTTAPPATSASTAPLQTPVGPASIAPTAAQRTPAATSAQTFLAQPSASVATSVAPTLATESASPEATATEAGPSGTPGPTPVIVAPQSVAPGVTVVRWYCCLGAGNDPRQVKVETKVINDFNSSHTDIQIQGEFVNYTEAYDTLATEIAGGNPPDIVGPVGFGGANAFSGHWLDLAPLIQRTGYDISQFESSAVDYFKVGTAQEGLPFAIYPSELYYQRGMFAEIGINEPPHKYGDQYVATGPAAAALNVSDGTSVPWDYNTARTLAMLLTVDKGNKDATESGFDPANIAQYGFEPQRDDLRGLGAYWGAGSLVGSDGSAQIPEPWSTAWKWYYNGMWTDHFIMDGSHFNDPNVWNPDGVPFCDGKIAMAENFLWSTYCLAGAGDNWDIAAIPAYNGTQTAAFNADTFRIWKDTKNPDASFTVLQYFLGDAAGKLTQTYGAMPAREELRQNFFDTLSSGFNLRKPVDWQVAIDGIDHADVPNFESPLPTNKSGENTYNESVSAISTYATRWYSQAGLDIDQQVSQMKQDLQTIWNK